jgi:hypothetical protein
MIQAYLRAVTCGMWASAEEKREVRDARNRREKAEEVQGQQVRDPH